MKSLNLTEKSTLVLHWKNILCIENRMLFDFFFKFFRLTTEFLSHNFKKQNVEGYTKPATNTHTSLLC